MEFCCAGFTLVDVDLTTCLQFPEIFQRDNKAFKVNANVEKQTSTKMP